MKDVSKTAPENPADSDEITYFDLETMAVLFTLPRTVRPDGTTEWVNAKGVRWTSVPYMRGPDILVPHFPGVYKVTTGKRKGSLVFNVPELLAIVGAENTPEMYVAMSETVKLMAIATERDFGGFLWPDA